MIVNERQKTTFYQSLVEILLYFDFAKVEKVMKHLKWRWVLSDADYEEFEDGVDGQLCEKYDELGLKNGTIQKAVPYAPFLKRHIVHQFEDMLRTIESGEADNWIIKKYDDGVEEVEYTISCGGFQYTIRSDFEDEDTFYLQLEFVVEEWNTFE